MKRRAKEGRRCILHGSSKPYIQKAWKVKKPRRGGVLREPSERDALTGLLNRDGFNKNVRSLIDSYPETTFVLVYGDIDRFKVFNDLYGTEAGDQLLASVGSMISRSLPPRAVAAHLRADHFIACMPLESFDAPTFLRALDAWFDAYSIDFAFFVRLGVYIIKNPSLDVVLMSDRALLSLRAAKDGHAGSRFAYYHEGMRDSVLREQELAGEMAVAIEQGQIVPFFQPQYRYSTGAMVGAEVLARWNHPTKGLLSPAEFIPVFERNGLIAEFDHAMWESACRCLRTWIDERGIENVVRLSLNLSRADIYQADLCASLSELVARYQLPPELLHLEITESAYMEAPEQLVEAVTSLRDAGFVVEMDDFGSGYSSLNTLKDVPVDILKLDMGFLDASESSRGGLILASVVRMARWLDLPTIAEGVETTEQAKYLTSIGCDYMQGYLFSRPVDQATFERMLDSGALEGIGQPLVERTQSDAMEFWTSDSLYAFLFNSYLGAAALAEYDGEKLEIVRTNEDFDALFNFDDEKMALRMRKDLLAELREKDRAALVEALARIDESIEDAECEIQLHSKEGRGQWIRLSFKQLVHTDDVNGLYVRAEETTEMQMLRERLSAMADTIPGGLVFYERDAHGVHLVDFNDVTAALTGRTREEFAEWVAEDGFAFIHEDDRPFVDAVIDELHAGARRASYTMRVNHRSRPLVWVSVSVSVIYRSEDVQYAIAVAIDVTKEKESEARLREQNAVQERLYDAVPCGIVRSTANVDEPLILSANRMACELFGSENFGQLLACTGGDLFSVVHPDDVERHKEEFRHLLAGESVVPFSYRYVRHDGSVGWAEGTSSLAQDADGNQIVQSAFTDVSDRQEQNHKRDIARFSAVLCTAYEEIFELDFANEAYHLLYSANRPIAKKTLPLDEALAEQYQNMPDANERIALQKAVDECRLGDGKKPLTCTYKVEVGEELQWHQTTFLRISSGSVLCCNKDVTARLSEEERATVMRVADAMGKLPVGVGVYALRNNRAYPLYVNDRMCFMFGYSAEEYSRRIERGLEVAASSDVNRWMEHYDLEELYRTGLDAELRTTRRDGTPIDVRIQGHVMHEEHGETLLYAVVNDITDELRERRERAWQNERYRLLSEMTHAISFDYDSENDTVLLYMDRTGEGMEEQVIPRYLETLSSERKGVVHPDSIDAVRELFEEARAGADQVGAEYQADYYGRGYAWYRTNLFVVHDKAGAWHLVGLIEGIDDERKLRFRAEYDATTGLSNHATTQELITAALADPYVREHSVCVALDLDDFKQVNDSFGHIEGDALLHAIGDILRSSFRESDIIGRVGGDEFVILLKNIDLDQALHKLDGVRTRLAATRVNNTDSSPSVSMGVYVTQLSDRAYRDVFVKADEALYRAKRSGKNRIVLYGNGSTDQPDVLIIDKQITES